MTGTVIHTVSAEDHDKDDDHDDGENMMIFPIVAIALLFNELYHVHLCHGISQKCDGKRDFCFDDVIFYSFICQSIT